MILIYFDKRRKKVLKILLCLIIFIFRFDLGFCLDFWDDFCFLIGVIFFGFFRFVYLTLIFDLGRFGLGDGDFRFRIILVVGFCGVYNLYKYL